MYKKGDFHIHSTYSDGGYTPRQVIMLSKKKNVDIIALTDHNNTCGLDEAIIAGKELGLKSFLELNFLLDIIMLMYMF